jgi:rhomboid family GlyGly-CTERM serine protease
MNKSPSALFAAHWALPLAIIVAAAVLQLAGDVPSLRYERGAWLAEPWRLLTAHLVHLGWIHLALNMAALLITWSLLGRAISAGGWCAVIVTCAVAVSLGLAWFSPAVAWYVGFSGILHGMLVAGAFAGLRRMRLMSSILLALLLAKLGFEQFVSGSDVTAMLIGGDVIVDAHLYGAIAGAFCGACWLFAARAR